jgi:hypothetical protein
LEAGAHVPPWQSLEQHIEASVHVAPSAEQLEKTSFEPSAPASAFALKSGTVSEPHASTSAKAKNSPPRQTWFRMLTESVRTRTKRLRR